jgi:hypothetical protein
VSNDRKAPAIAVPGMKGLPWASFRSGASVTGFSWLPPMCTAVRATSFAVITR